MAEVNSDQKTSRAAGSAQSSAIEPEYLPYTSASDLENGVAQPGIHSENDSKSPSPPTSDDFVHKLPSDPQQQQQQIPNGGANEGYMRLAKWMAGCDDFFVIRKFSALTAFVLLKVQDDLVQLERKIGELDLNQGEAGIAGESFRGDNRDELSRLVDGEVLPKLKVYC
jgi:hypothetical protein